ncbi:hypothetical protein NDU88_002588 [Pleurodeles waltl]|uniref:Uncharacterized protein n=1 Tax=Pleurodeles waltl TaxID=8319 RepID=A0AAV7SF31_PLEWA|nr:hypothetical protein NDU88_002588 [Pleurodeles waltl]
MVPRQPRCNRTRGKGGGDHRAGGSGARGSPRPAGGEPGQRHHPRPSPPKAGTQIARPPKGFMALIKYRE